MISIKKNRSGHTKYRIKKSPTDWIAKVVAIALTAFFALVCVLPMWHVLAASFSDPIEYSLYDGFLFWPISYSLEGFELLFSYNNLWSSYLNTVIYTVGATSLGLLLDLLAAYVLSRKNVMLKRVLMVFIIITMLFNGGVIPLYLVVRSLGLTNTRWAMIIPACCNAMSIIMLKNGMESVNDAICEAAQIDGAGHVRILWQIMLPLTTAFIATVVLFNGIGHWNSWVNASMFISASHKDLYPLQLIMRDILIDNSTEGVVSPSGYPLEFYLPSLRVVMVVVGSLPLIIMYPFVQKYFEKGIIIGGVKG